MRYFSGIFCTFLIALSLVSAKDIKLEKKGENSIIYTSEVYTIGDLPIHNDPNESREQIDLIFEDFEGEDDWDPTEGWNLTTTNYHSETSSYVSPDYLPTDENGEPTY